MNLIIFTIVLVISFIVVRIGAIAFQLTGLEWSLAKFQALSCFSGTGFTTKESELIVSNPQRRKIASVLIVLGNAGLVTLIATFANSIRPRATGQKISLPFLKDFLPEAVLPWMSLVIIMAIIFVMYKLFTNIGFTGKVTNLLRNFVMKKDIIKTVTAEELLIATGGYGVSRIKITPNSSIIDKSLADSHLRSHDITVLAITRSNETIPNPSPGTVFNVDDELICFGKLENIQNIITLSAN
ncbi:MAG: hypothetical protein JW806_06445 [Sedimentisphaerales bacterium]|nr:hypothetical protein [Sedimentisphaerales bacterium]